VFSSFTPVSGLIFETKNRALFSGELFYGEEFLEQHYCPYNFVPSNWLWSGFIKPPPPFVFFSFPLKESFDVKTQHEES